ncbi:MAG: hypothetical protein GY756_19150 [bacterium]|nr:hypothetical protein [bacterium]
MNQLSNKWHYISNLASHYGTTIVTTLIGFISVPISLNYWKVEQYGIWVIITSLATYLAVSGLGIDVASGILMTKNNSLEVKKKIFFRSMKLVTIMSVFLLILFTISNNIFPSWINLIGNVSPDIIGTTQSTAIIFIFFFLINLPFGVIANSFASYQRAFYNNLFNSVQAVCILSILLIIVKIKGSLIEYAVLYGGTIFAINVVKAITLYKLVRKIRKSHKNTIETVSTTSQDCSYKMIFITGLRLSFYGLAVIISTNIGNLLISNFLDVSSVTPYSINYKLYMIMFMFLTGINLSMAPLLGKEFGEKNWKWLRGTYNNLFKVTVSIGTLIWVFGVFFIDDIVRLWVGETGAVNFPTIILLGAWIFCSSLSNLNFVVINSFNYTKSIGFISWAETVVFIVCSIFFLPRIGVLGVPLALVIGSTLTSQWLLPVVVYNNSFKKIKYDFKFLFQTLIVVVIFISFGIFVNIQIESIIIKLILELVSFLIYLLFILFRLPKDIINVIMGKLRLIS